MFNQQQQQHKHRHTRKKKWIEERNGYNEHINARRVWEEDETVKTSIALLTRTTAHQSLWIMYEYVSIHVAGGILIPSMYGTFPFLSRGKNSECLSGMSESVRCLCDECGTGHKKLLRFLQRRLTPEGWITFVYYLRTHTHTHVPYTQTQIFTYQKLHV